MTPTSVPHGPAVSWPCTCMRTGMARTGDGRRARPRDRIVGPSGVSWGCGVTASSTRSPVALRGVGARNTRRYIAVICIRLRGGSVDGGQGAHSGPSPSTGLDHSSLGGEARSILTSWP